MLLRLKCNLGVAVLAPYYSFSSDPCLIGTGLMSLCSSFEDKDFLKKHLQLFKKNKSVPAKDVKQLNNQNKFKRGKATASSNNSNSFASIATKTKPLSVSPTKREDDPSCKTRQSRRPLDFNQAEKIPNTAYLPGEKCNDSEQTTSLSLQTEDTTSIKRRLVQENDELKKKVARLENEKEEERKILIMDKSRNLKNNSIHLKKFTNKKYDGPDCFPSSAVSTQYSSSPLANPTKQLDKFYGDILIDPDALKNAVAYGSTPSTDHNLNLMINTILDAFFKQSELAAFSLTGKPCPNMKSSKAKPKNPQQIMQALKVRNEKKISKPRESNTRCLNS
ncbi:hypothetical protein OUZ56_011622 [Daphnia magna]|uniref:BEN domain-containing protein n=1 Tax=Daphnia magna TaxID=35525 RepID=A0ABQ9Z100_9CRUS|nr:hypothetical protein OUZ56_011622 [Daphnia magna]